MPLPLPPPTAPRRAFAWLPGALAAVAATGALYAGVAWLEVGKGVHGLIAPSLFLVPFFGGLLAALMWRGLQPRIGEAALWSLWVTLLACVGATVLYHEGFICLLIAAPLFYGMTLAGALVGRVWFRAAPDRLRFSLMPLVALAAAAAVEPSLRPDHEAFVADELLVRAPPAKVWRHVTAFPEIPTPPSFWMFRLGLPCPMATTSAGDFVGADRRCIFSRGAVFREVVTECDPPARLTFDMVELPNDPELIGHLTPKRGRFELRDNGNGTTTLVGTTWYSLHVHPRWYFDAWTRHIFRAVHLRVMEDVRRRAEQE